MALIDREDISVKEGQKELTIRDILKAKGYRIDGPWIYDPKEDRYKKGIFSKKHVKAVAVACLHNSSLIEVYGRQYFERLRKELGSVTNSMEGNLELVLVRENPDTINPSDDDWGL